MNNYTLNILYYKAKNEEEENGIEDVSINKMNRLKKRVEEFKHKISEVATITIVKI